MFFMTEKYINIDLNDPRSGKIAEVLTNKTAKKILELLSENEMSASEIADKLKLPLNTIGYNLDNLIKSGLIEKVSGFLWSSKGKKIEKYKLSNKKIVISPRNIAGGIIPAILGSVILAGLVKYFNSGSIVQQEVITSGSEKMMDSSISAVAGEIAPQVVNNIPNSVEVWPWFLLGAFSALLLYLLINILNERRRN